MSSLGFSGIALGDIYPARFVKAGTGGFSIAQCVANDPVFGISHLGTNQPPIPGMVSDKAAVAGGSIRIHKPGERCHIQAGAAIVSGNRLKPDVNGMGVPCANNVATGEQYGCVALQDAQPNEFCECEVMIGSHTGA